MYEGDKRKAVLADLEGVINRHSLENGSNTPDWILASMLLATLEAYDSTVRARADWYGRHDVPGQSSPPSGKSQEGT